jgi:acetyl-CoA carboxylase carboxyl transferase subunit beta
VIEQITRQKLPAGFQTAEFLLAHGMIDMIVPRADLSATLATLFRHYARSARQLPQDAATEIPRPHAEPATVGDD